MSETDWLRVYLAGPDVFLPNAREIGAAKIAICAGSGLTGVFPLDGDLNLAGLEPYEQARRIALGNEDLMRSCDAIIANLTPFRGASMDAGTAFEVGFMRALGRPVFGYTNTATAYAERVRSLRDAGRAKGDFDGPDVEIEDFGLAENLMIAIAISETGDGPVLHASPDARIATDLTGFEKAVAIAASSLRGGG